MGIRTTEGVTVRATLCEVERGLFHVAYTVNGAGLGKHYLPRYEVGTCASEVKQRIEQRARESGYDAIVWEPALTHLGLVPSSAEDPAHPAR